MSHHNVTTVQADKLTRSNAQLAKTVLVGAGGWAQVRHVSSDVKSRIHAGRHFESTAYEINLKYELLGLPIPPKQRKIRPEALPTLHLPIITDSDSISIDDIVSRRLGKKRFLEEIPVPIDEAAAAPEIGVTSVRMYVKKETPKMRLLEGDEVEERDWLFAENSVWMQEKRVWEEERPDIMKERDKLLGEKSECMKERSDLEKQML
ncbi:hypothetical protein Pcinc_022936 [Petrolisthes cinctipes]|uniref:Uncharacterized protein n=1 Tax=Petrolisthes cinctipes TaxID=88211 RepID=A0AAE1KG05_PETCI|nr:hypothetical protein Pcinc_022936 [Petrolisthes cinctipes]